MRQRVLLGTDIQSPTKVLARLSTFPVSVKAIYHFTPLLPIQRCLSWWRLSLLVSNIVGGGGGGRGFLILVMALVIVSKIAYQCMFQLSDPGVPRTFVEDCSSHVVITPINRLCGVLRSWLREKLEISVFIKTAPVAKLLSWQQQ